MDILKEEGAFDPERKARFPRIAGEGGAAVGGTDATANGSATPGKGGKDARVLIHAYSGSLEQAMQYVKLGATISIAGSVTYRNNRKTAEVARAVPATRLVIESDAPYILPEPARTEYVAQKDPAAGRVSMLVNTPTNLRLTAQKVADLRGIPYAELAALTTHNALRFFGL